MADYAHKQTDREIDLLEKRLAKEYEQAEKEMQKKAEEYFKKFEKKDEEWRKKVEAAKGDRKEYKKVKKEYEQWRKGQMAVGDRWNDMRDSLANDLAHTNQIARDIVEGTKPKVYGLNYNYATYEIEKGGRVNTGFTSYDRNAVAYLMGDNPKFLPDPGRVTRNRIANQLDVRYNRQQLQSIMMQGILQGESIPKIAQRMTVELGERNHHAAVRNARTAMTSIQNKGRMDSYERAEEIGIQMKKRWMATHDNRTRHWHVELDGQEVDVDEPFINEYGEIMYPGDPDADPANVYNCRCTLIASRVKVKSYSERLKEYKVAKNMGFEDWEEAKREELEDE